MDVLDLRIAMQSAAELQYDRWNPRDYASHDDQQHPGTTFLQNYKADLMSTETRDQSLQPRGSLGTPCLQELLASDQLCQLSWPLSSFMTDLDLPTNEETHILCSTAISRFSPHCAILRMLPTATLLEGENYLLQALAALGATLNNSAYREALWVHANRTLTTILSIKNSKLRDFRAHAAWLLLETAAFMSSDSGLWRLANIARGFPETAIRRLWKIQNSVTCSETASKQDEMYGPMATYALQIDLVKAMNTGCSPTIAASFSQLPFGESSNLSITEYQRRIFSSDDDGWLANVHDGDLCSLLIILNQQIVFSQNLVFTKDERNFEHVSRETISSLSLEEENERSTNKITTALSRWRKSYFQISSPALLALYHFTKLATLFPSLQHILLEVNYATHHQRERVSKEVSMTAPSPEAVDSAWLLLDNVSQSKDRDHIWLPTITLLAALCIWKHIKLQGQYRVYGSLTVLRLFRSELITMPWPCCRTMIRTLDDLMRSK